MSSSSRLDLRGPKTLSILMVLSFWFFSGCLGRRKTISNCRQMLKINRTITTASNSRNLFDSMLGFFSGSGVGGVLWLAAADTMEKFSFWNILSASLAFKHGGQTGGGMGAAVVLGGSVGHKMGFGVVVAGGGCVVLGSGWVMLKVQLQWHTGGGGAVGALVDWVGLAVVEVVGGTVGQVAGVGIGGGAGHFVRCKLISYKSGHCQLTVAFKGVQRQRFWVLFTVSIFKVSIGQCRLTLEAKMKNESNYFHIRKQF